MMTLAVFRVFLPIRTKSQRLGAEGVSVSYLDAFLIVVAFGGWVYAYRPVGFGSSPLGVPS